MDNQGFQQDLTDDGVTKNESLESKKNQLCTLDKEKKWNSSHIRQIICTIIISSGVYVIAFLIGSTSMLPGLLNTYSKEANFTAEDIKWFASTPLIVSIVVSPLATYIAGLVGPTYLLRGSLITSFFIFNVPVVFPSLATIGASRVLLFVMVSMFDVVCVPLVTELSEPSIRGMTGVFPGLTGSFGILFVFITFTFFSGRLAIMCSSIPLLLGFVGSLFVPQSPYWLIQRGRKSDAISSFTRVVGPWRKEKVEKLVQETISIYEKSKGKLSTLHQIKLLTKSRNWKPLVFMVTLFGLREFGGHGVIFFYALQIFQQADVSIDAFLCTIIVGVVIVVSTFLGSFIHDKFGRRTILIGTYFVSALCLLVGGLTLYYKNPVLKILPLVSIIGLIVMTGIGIGPLCFTLMGELTTSEVKFISIAIIYSVFNLFQFTVVQTTPSLLRIIGIGRLFLTFSAVNFFATFLLYFVLPETKYKTLTELEALFS